MSRKKKIKKPWCVYRHGIPAGIGNVLIEYKSSALVLFCEGEDCSPELCGKKDLWRFTTITAAIKKFRKCGGCDLDKLKKALSSHFPFKAKEIAKIKNIYGGLSMDDKDDKDEVRIERVLPNGVIIYDFWSILESPHAKRHLRALREIFIKQQARLKKQKGKK